MSRDHDPLDQEERALADALARATPRTGPPPGLDAAILASARRALQADAAAPDRPHRRWPAALGVAASLALAVGIAWQLRPAPDAALPAAREPVQADAAAGSKTAALPPREVPADPLPAPEPTPPMPEPARSTAPAPASAPAIQEESRLPAFQPTSPPVDTAIGRRSVHQAATADDIVFEHEGLDDEPPATLDSPQTRRAWLDRIRELRDDGELDVARESLREYRRRYPDLDLPEDLEGLLSE